VRVSFFFPLPEKFPVNVFPEAEGETAHKGPFVVAQDYPFVALRDQALFLVPPARPQRNTPYRYRCCIRGKRKKAWGYHDPSSSSMIFLDPGYYYHSSRLEYLCFFLRV